LERYFEYFTQLRILGYVLPISLSQHSELYSSIIVGLMWSIWHLPLFFFARPLVISPLTAKNFATQFGGYTFFCITFSILMTGLHRASAGSVAVATIAHAALDSAVGVLGFAPPTPTSPLMHNFMALLGTASLLIHLTFSSMS